MTRQSEELLIQKNARIVRKEYEKRLSNALVAYAKSTR